MSDNQRRLFCQFLFFLLCALPTVVTAYWICHPQTAGGWEQTLQAKLGINTSIDSIETPGPFVTVLRGLEFSDPDMGSLFKAVEARIEFGRDENYVTIPYRVQNLTNRSLACLIENLNQNLIRSQEVEKPWRVKLLKETVVSQQTDPATEPMQNPIARQFVMSKNAKIDVFRRVDGTYAVASFTVPSSKTPDELVECGISRTKEYGEALVLDSNTVDIPCWLASESVAFVGTTLGSEATFSGRVEVLPVNSQVKIDGRIENVDLQLTDQSVANHERFGMIELNDCVFQEGIAKKWEGLLFQGADKMLISQNDLFNFTRQFAPGRAIGGALIERTQRTARQANGETWSR